MLNESYYNFTNKLYCKELLKILGEPGIPWDLWTLRLCKCLISFRYTRILCTVFISW